MRRCGCLEINPAHSGAHRRTQDRLTEKSVLTRVDRIVALEAGGYTLVRIRPHGTKVKHTLGTMASQLDFTAIPDQEFGNTQDMKLNNMAIV